MAKETLLALIFGTILGVAVVSLLPTSSQAQTAADGCLTKPNRAPPKGSHWYYRTDRSNSRRCWYVGPIRENKIREAAAVSGTSSTVRLTGSAGASVLSSPGSARSDPAMSDGEKEALFQQFLEWEKARANR
jgi:hypothetical protein